MIEKLVPLKFPPGFYRNGTKYEAKSRWYDGNLVRFYEGAIRPVQGWRIAFDADNNPMPTLAGVPRAAFGWRSALGEVQIAVGTTEELYVLKDGVAYVVTPSDFDPGAQNASSGAGNGDFGNGVFGRGLFGIGRAPLAAQLTDADTWQLDAFGDTLVACCTNGGRIYVWTGDTAALAEVAAGSPEPCRGVVITPERFLMALGADDDVRKVMWASQGSTTTWTPAEENTAGDFTLTTQGRIMCGRRTPAQTLIFTDADLHSANYTGGEFIYSFKQEGDNCGIVSPQAVAIVDTTAIWMGRDNFYGYDGFVKPIPCSVHDYVFDDFNSQQASKVFACPVSEFGEVWFFYPSAGSVENDRYVVYNYRENHWTTGRLSRTAAIDRGAVPNPVMFDGLGSIYTHELSAGGTRTVPATALFSDSLEDTAAVTLEAHTPVPGVFAWAYGQGATLAFDATNRLIKTVSASPAVYTVDETVDADTGGSVKLRLDAAVGTDFAGVGVRMAGGASAAGYYFGIRSDGVFLICGLDAAGAVLFSDTTPLLPNQYGVNLNIELLPLGSVLTALVDGQQVFQTTDTTYATGKVGLYGGGGFGVTLVTDAFIDTNGTALTSHSFSGRTWLKTLGSGIVTIQSNVAMDNTAGTASLHMVDTAPSSADYAVRATVTNSGADYSLFNIFDLRARGNLTDHASYVLRVTAGAPSVAGEFKVQLGRLDAAMALTDLGGSVYSTGISTHVGATFALRCVGSLIQALVNGVVVLSATDATLSAAGYAGMYNDGNPTTLPHMIENFEIAEGSGITTTELYIAGPYRVLAYPSLPVGTDPDTITVNEDGTIILVPYIESGPVELGDGDNVFKVQRIVPDERNLGDVRARFFTALYPTAAETERGPYTLANPTAVRFTARQLRLRFEEAVETNWRIGVTRLGIIQGGTR